jgi:outer membrane lipoprotein-sorting protein
LKTKEERMHVRQFSKTRRVLTAAAGLALVVGLAAATPAQADRPGRSGADSGGTVVPLSAALQISRTTVDAAGQRQTSQETQHLYRDSAGRTRTEAGGTVTIADPTAKTTLTLDVATRTFHRSASTTPAGDAAKRQAPGEKNRSSKSLGTATVSGVSVKGSQYEVKLPATRDLPARTKKVTLWLSTDVQLPVRTQVVEDSGAVNTQTYTDIKPGVEPAAELFRVPAGYREAVPGQATGAGTLASCPNQNDDPVFLTSFDLLYLDARYVNAITDGSIGCSFVFDQLVLLDYPLNAFPTVDLFLPFDQWLVYDNGGLLPFLPYVAFADIVFVSGNGSDSTTKDSFITLTVFPV